MESRVTTVTVGFHTIETLRNECKTPDRILKCKLQIFLKGLIVERENREVCSGYINVPTQLLLLDRGKLFMNYSSQTALLVTLYSNIYVIYSNVKYELRLILISRIFLGHPLHFKSQ